MEQPQPSRVLLVEDDEAARAGYAKFLTLSGYTVLEAATGEAALMAANAWHPDVIVLDLGLPDIDGWEIARQLKATPHTQAVPIIALTGADLPHERVSAMRAGCERPPRKTVCPQRAPARHPTVHHLGLVTNL